MPDVLETDVPPEDTKLTKLVPQCLDVPINEISDLLIHSNIDDDTKTKEDIVHQFFETLYKDYPLKVAKSVSREERKANGYLSCTLVYGEIDLGAFRTMFEMVKKSHEVLVKPGGVFLDIGCGSGRPVFAAALLHDFDACIGYEILSGLADIAQEVFLIWQREKSRLNALKKRTRILVTNTDATKVDWPMADFIFCNSTCFDDRLMRVITRNAAIALRTGGVIVTATKQLFLQDIRDNSIELVQTCKMQESWGDATLHIYKKQI